MHFENKIPITFNFYTFYIYKTVGHLKKVVLIAYSSFSDSFRSF